MVIFRLDRSAHDAVDRTVAAAHKAETAGYQHVHTGYDPQHGTYTVHGDQPTQQPGGGARLPLTAPGRRYSGKPPRP